MATSTRPKTLNDLEKLNLEAETSYAETKAIIESAKTKDSDAWCRMGRLGAIVVGDFARRAIEAGKDRIVTLLLEEGMSPALRGVEVNNELLYFAVRSGDPIFSLILEALENTVRKESKIRSYQAGMQAAVETRNIKIATLLLKKGVSPDKYVTDPDVCYMRDQLSYLAYAALQNWRDLALLLVQHGADVGKALRVFYLTKPGTHIQDDSGFRVQKTQGIKFLLDYAAGVNWRHLDPGDLDFWKDLREVAGVNFIGISYRGKPITKDFLSSLELKHTARALTSLPQLEVLKTTEVERYNHIQQCLAAAFEKRGRYVEEESQLVNLVSLKWAAIVGNEEVVTFRMPYSSETDINIALLAAVNEAANLEVIKILTASPQIWKETLPEAIRIGQSRNKHRIVEHLQSLQDSKSTDCKARPLLCPPNDHAGPGSGSTKPGTLHPYRVKISQYKAQSRGSAAWYIPIMQEAWIMNSDTQALEILGLLKNEGVDFEEQYQTLGEWLHKLVVDFPSKELIYQKAERLFKGRIEQMCPSRKLEEEYLQRYLKVEIALHKVLFKRKLHRLRFLLENGVDPNLLEGEVPTYDVEKKNADTFLHVLLRNCDLDHIEHGYEQVINMFVSYGFNINAQNADGETLLHVAVSECRMAAIRPLLAKRINIDAREKNGLTALHYTHYTLAIPKSKVNLKKKDRDSLEIILLLIQTGASVLPDNEGITPLAYLETSHCSPSSDRFKEAKASLRRKELQQLEEVKVVGECFDDGKVSSLQWIMSKHIASCNIDLTRCDFIVFGRPLKQAELSDFKIESNAAYVGGGTSLFYINRLKQRFIQINLFSTTLIKLATAIAKWKPHRVLTLEDLKMITSITGHSHFNECGLTETHVEIIGKAKPFVRMIDKWDPSPSERSPRQRAGREEKFSAHEGPHEKSKALGEKIRDKYYARLGIAHRFVSKDKEKQPEANALGEKIRNKYYARLGCAIRITN